jgi:hypothetical protein
MIDLLLIHALEDLHIDGDGHGHILRSSTRTDHKSHLVTTIVPQSSQRPRPQEHRANELARLCLQSPTVTAISTGTKLISRTTISSPGP